MPAGTTLRAVPAQVSSGPGWHFDRRGFVQVDGNGAVLRDLYIPYNVNVTASNVTIADDRIKVAGNSFGVSLRHTSDVTIENCDISSPFSGPKRLMDGVKDIYGDSTGLRVLRNDIAHTGTGVHVESGLIEGNYIHAMGYRKGDHVNGVTSDGGNTSPLVVRHNTIFVHRAQTDAVSLFETLGAQANRLIADNLLAGGGYTIYGGRNHGGPPTHNIRIVGNLISRVFYPHGGYYGQVATFNPKGRGNAWRSNAWAGNSRHTVGTPIPDP